MNKQDVKLKIKACLYDLGIKQGEYIIVYGAASVLRNIKNSCNDIDVVLSYDAFDHIVQSRGIKPAKYSDKENHYFFRYEDDIDLFRGTVGMAVHEIQGTEIEDGLIVQTIFSLLCEKRQRGRDKDLRDIPAIKAALTEERNTEITGGEKKIYTIS